MTSLTPEQEGIIARASENGVTDAAKDYLAKIKSTPDGVIVFASGGHAALGEVLAVLEMASLFANLGADPAMLLEKVTSEVANLQVVIGGLELYAIGQTEIGTGLAEALAEMQRTAPDKFQDVVDTYEDLISGN